MIRSITSYYVTITGNLLNKVHCEVLTHRITTPTDWWQQFPNNLDQNIKYKCTAEKTKKCDRKYANILLIIVYAYILGGPVKQFFTNFLTVLSFSVHSKMLYQGVTAKFVQSKYCIYVLWNIW